MRNDVIELVFVSGTQMCLNAHHPVLPTFGWEWKFHANGVDANALAHQDGWQLDYVGRHPTNIYVFLFVVNSGINEMYSDLPLQYWEGVEKMIATRRLCNLARQECRFLDEMAYEMLMFMGEVVMESLLE